MSLRTYRTRQQREQARSQKKSRRNHRMAEEGRSGPVTVRKATREDIVRIYKGKVTEEEIARILGE